MRLIHGYLHLLNRDCKVNTTFQQVKNLFFGEEIIEQFYEVNTAFLILLEKLYSTELKSASHQKNSKTHNMKGLREKNNNPKHKNERDCKQAKPEKNTRRNAMNGKERKQQPTAEKQSKERNTERKTLQ